MLCSISPFSAMFVYNLDHRFQDVVWPVVDDGDEEDDVGDERDARDGHVCRKPPGRLQDQVLVALGTVVRRLLHQGVVLLFDEAGVLHPDEDIQISSILFGLYLPHYYSIWSIYAPWSNKIVLQSGLVQITCRHGALYLKEMNNRIGPKVKLV